MALLDGKVVLVTGGGRNVGAGIVRSLVREGATVAINCFRSPDRANAFASELEAQGGDVSVWPCDVADSDGVKAMVDGIVDRYGRIDAVVNNASDCRPGGAIPLEDNAWECYINEFEVSVKAVINTTLAARPHMRSQGGGRIVGIVTEQWNEASPGGYNHVTGKAAMVGLCRKMVFELGPENITVNLVSPGWTRTERTNNRDTPDHPYIQGTPLRRMSEAEDIGDACVFFISDLAKNVSGAYLLVNGGRHPQMGG